ncbi:MAG: translation initiation factor IF-2 [Alphaproteobacteria bacterium GM202ARS2]|nr:translation initiation factor IF-2 [Alphaproteobacteria bacterium GM202ARS2]
MSKDESGTLKGGGKGDGGERSRVKLRRTVETSQIWQSFSHGRSRMVEVEIKRRRGFKKGEEGAGGAGGAGRDKEREERARPPVGEQGGEQVREERAERVETQRDDRGGQEARREARREGGQREGQRGGERERGGQRGGAREGQRGGQQRGGQREGQREGQRGDTSGVESKESLVRGSRPSKSLSKSSKSSERSKGGGRGKRGQRHGGVGGDGGSKGFGGKRSGKLTITSSLEEGGDERMRSMAAVRRARQKQQKQRMEADKAMGGGAAPRKVSREVVVPETIMVSELANRMAERGADVAKVLMGMGVMAHINEAIDQDTAELVIAEFGHRIKRVSDSDVEIGLGGGVDDRATLEPRPPVVTIMGHVDHGKTSLLDALAGSKIVAGEKGGITQHIGAYQIRSKKGGEPITFLDTPGHEAFTKMRIRGATVTDIVVVVIAADDGVKPQTVEALNHAKAANVPVIIAVNKIDAAGADIDKVYQELLSHHVVVEKMRGEVLSCELSALQKRNLESLEEMILLQSNMMDLKAASARSAVGTVLEARMERGRGSIVSVLVQKGTLNKGDIFVAGKRWGRVRAMVVGGGVGGSDAKGGHKQAYPSQPVDILGCDGVPEAGDEFVVVESEARAKEVARYRSTLRQRDTSSLSSMSIEERMKRSSDEERTFPVIIKADTQGSVEAISTSLHSLLHDFERELKVVHYGVGEVSESDVLLAATTGACIVGFNLRSNPSARVLSRKHRVEIKDYGVIYDLVEDFRVRLQAAGGDDKEAVMLGRATVQKVFDIGKVGKVAGCMVVEGRMRADERVRLLRDDEVITETRVRHLKREKDDVREVRSGTECGISLVAFSDIQEGDILECYHLSSD